jgi:hypothetical protein
MVRPDVIALWRAAVSEIAMPLTLLKFLGPLVPYLAGAGALLGAVLYAVTLRHDLATATLKNAALAQANQADSAAIASYQAQQASWNAAMDRLNTQSLAAAAATGRIMNGIAAAPAADDAPVAPVLAQALAGLRALQGGTP